MASTTRTRTRRETKPAAPEETPKVEPDETPETGPAETPATGPDETKETPTERLAKPTVALTADVLAQLRRPFTAAAIRFKPQTVTKDQKKAMATFYVDARLVAERLNTVLGPDAWHDEYRLLALADNAQAFAGLHYPVECRLTVAGITKADVGVYQKSAPDSMAMKSAYSDALKRAAVKFGIGAYLYALPKVWEETKIGGNGKAQGFTDAAERRLRAAYEKALASMTFGDPLDHGDVGDDPDVAPEPEPEAEVDPKDVATPDDLAELAALAKAKGFDRDGFVAVVKPHREENDGNVLKSWIAERTAELEAMPDKAAEGGDEGNA